LNKDFVPLKGQTEEERLEEADKIVNEAMKEHDIAQEQIH